MGVKSYFSGVFDAFIGKRHYEQNSNPWYGSGYYPTGQNYANEAVSITSGSKISTVFTAINAISQDIAKLQFNVMKDGDNGKQVLKNNPIYRLIHTSPNENTTAFNFWYSVIWNALTEGNGYAVIVRDNNFIPTELIQVKSENVTVMKEGLDVFYRVGGEMIPSSDMLHIKMHSIDGICGLSPIMWNANVMGYKIKQERYSAQAIGTKGTGFITSQGLKEDQGQQVADQYKEAINQGKVPFLGTMGDTKWHNQMITPNEAQYIETRLQTNSEILGIYRLPPAFAQNYERATYANASQQDQVYVKHTLTPWLKLIEQECDRKLFKEANSTRSNPFYTKFNVNSILRGDIETRFNTYHNMILDGVYSADEVRELENMPPQPDGLGKKYYIQGAMREKGTEPIDNNPNEAQRSVNGHDKEIERLLQ
jgi:HK97 family phage portal protein